MIKRWTKRKKRAQNLICDSLRNRVQFHHTAYSRAHDRTGRCWITVDGNEVLNACYLNWQVRHNELANGIREANDCLGYIDSKQKVGYFQAYDGADAILHSQGVFSESDFLIAIDEWTNMSIDDAINSENRLVRTFSMIDRRLGKRRLKNIIVSPNEPPIVQMMYELRCSAESLRQLADIFST